MPNEEEPNEKKELKTMDKTKTALLENLFAIRSRTKDLRRTLEETTPTGTIKDALIILDAMENRVNDFENIIHGISEVKNY